MKYSTSKEIDRVVRKYIKRSWTFRRGKKHGHLYPPGSGLFVVVPCSPSDYRADSNFSQDLRRLEKKLYCGDSKCFIGGCQ